MLLSIIIPTKNRQFTTLYAIESALSINENDFEVIVQDCSDVNSLQKQIVDKFGNDSRIKYQYNDQKPSMTENWNDAFGRAQGDFFCAIGDDDAVLPFVYKVALWAKESNIKAVVQKEFIVYFWPDYHPQPYKGTLNYVPQFSDDFTIRVDLKERVRKYSSLRDPMDYMFLPQSYHCVFSKDIYTELIKDTGVFLDSTSLDVYTSIAFAGYLPQYAETGTPFTIRGACGKSNTQRLTKNKAEEHFNEFKRIDFPAILPPVYDFYTTVTEAFIKACNNTGQQNLISNIDLPSLYASIAVNENSNYQACKSKLLENVSDIDEQKRFQALYQKHKSSKRISSIQSIIKKRLPFILNIYRKFVPPPVKRTIVQATTILDAIQIIENDVKKLSHAG